MNSLHRWLYVIAFTAIGMVRAGESVSPESTSFSGSLALAPGADVAIGGNGNYIVNGKPRFLMGVQVLATDRLADDLLPTQGYGPEWRWLYEEPLSYANAQRLGFDSLSLNVDNQWLRAYVPGYRNPAAERGQGMIREVWGGGLPIQVDYSCFPWKHGVLAENREPFAGKLPPEAVNAYHSQNGNHWVPYNLLHPEALKAYRALWLRGVEERAAGGSPALMFELMNEPAYNDPGDYNRRRFAEYLAERYGDPSSMNHRWGSAYKDFAAAAAFTYPSDHPGLFVDWSRFMEAAVTGLARLGVETIRSAHPGASTSWQIMGGDYYRVLHRSNVNSYEIARLMDTISVPTGGGIAYGPGLGARTAPARAVEAPAVPPTITEGILQRHFFRAVADGKPLVNPEAYMGHSGADTFNRIWLDFARGLDAVYLFEWSKRAWDWKPAGTPEGGKAVAERFPWMILNPYAYPAAEFARIMDAKREIFRTAEFFLPRERRTPAEVAILLSQPTERMAGATGYIGKNEATAYAGALAFSHVPADVVLEEQLPSGRADRYRVLVAAGIRNTLPETLPALRKFVDNGGTLVVARSLLPEDEYGHPVPDAGLFAGLTAKDKTGAELADFTLNARQPDAFPGTVRGLVNLEVNASPEWEALASCGNAPAFLRKPLGRGAVYVVAARMQDYALAALLRMAFEREGVKPALSLSRVPEGDAAVNVEAHSAAHGGLTLHYLFNWDNYPKLLRLALPAGHAAADVLDNKAFPLRDGRALILLEPQQRLVVGVGNPAALAERFGAMAPVDADTLAQTLERKQRELSDTLEHLRAAGYRHPVDAAKLAPLDLRTFANRSFLDAVAGDGKGGWTDQGAENALVGVPWGQYEFLGVACDLIRTDHNDERGCIMLASTSLATPLPEAVTGIPVNEKVRSLVFFHTVAWNRDGAETMRYRIHYADGGTLDVPVVCGENIGDWWTGSPENRKIRHLVAWKNIAGRGFFGWRWPNPRPGVAVSSFDVISANNETIPVLIAVTAEKAGEGPDAEKTPVPTLTLSPDRYDAVGFNRAAAAWEGDALVLNATADTPAWSGVHIKAKRLTPFGLDDAALERSVLAFDVNGGVDQFGNPRGAQKVQLTLLAAKNDYRENRAAVMLNLETGLQLGRIDDDPESFQAVRIPLAKAKPSSKPYPEGINAVMLQFRGNTDSGIVVRNLRIETPDY